MAGRKVVRAWPQFPQNRLLGGFLAPQSPHWRLAGVAAMLSDLPEKPARSGLGGGASRNPAVRAERHSRDDSMTVAARHWRSNGDFNGFGKEHVMKGEPHPEQEYHRYKCVDKHFNQVIGGEDAC